MPAVIVLFEWLSSPEQAGVSCGGDVEFMAELMERRDGEEFSRILGAGRRVITAIRHMAKPVVPAVNGPAAGAGCNLALACDIRIASTPRRLQSRLLKLD
jgi:enoyl-CoA hydratase/carnithine racemase